MSYLEFDPSTLAGPSSSTPKPSSSSAESTPIDTGNRFIDLDTLIDFDRLTYRFG